MRPPNSGCKQSLDLSLETTQFQSVAVQVSCSWYTLNKGDGSWLSMAGDLIGPLTPASAKHLETGQAETGVYSEGVSGWWKQL